MESEQKILEIIASIGCISLEQLMGIALCCDDSSYYRSHYAIGKEHDFITAPEISQLFSEMICVWAILQWQSLERPRFNLIELGPGRATLMFDLLKTCKKIAPDFFASIEQIILLEINPHLIAIQKAKLAEFALPIVHISDITQIDVRPSIIIANEFFDALPIEQYQKIYDKWYKVVVRSAKDDKKLYFSTENSQVFDFPEHINAGDQGILEIATQALNMLKKLLDQLVKNRGAMLIADYGYCCEPNNRLPQQYCSSLQAVKNHEFHLFLQNLSHADLTSHVDFFAIKQLAISSGISNIMFQTQRQFLDSYGISWRIKMLIEKNPHLKTIILKQYRYLTQKMGNLFKILSLKSF